MEVKGRKKWGTLFNLPLLPLGTRTWELHKASNLDEVSESKVTQHQLRLCRWCFKSPQSWRQIQSRFTCFWWTSPVYGNCVTLPVTWEPHMIWPTFCSWMFPFRCDCCSCSCSCCCCCSSIYTKTRVPTNKIQTKTPSPIAIHFSTLKSFWRPYDIMWISIPTPLEWKSPSYWGPPTPEIKSWSAFPNLSQHWGWGLTVSGSRSHSNPRVKPPL